jgi:hypothetical protein
MIEALVEFGDQLITKEPKRNSLIDFSTEMRIVRLLARLMSCIDKTDRFSVMKTIFAQKSPSFTQVYLLRILTAAGISSGFKYADVLPEPEIKQLENLILKRICKLDFDWKSFSESKLAVMLNVLKTKLDYPQFELARKTCLNDSKRLASFIETYLQEVQTISMGDKVAKKKTNFEYASLCELINPSEIIDKAREALKLSKGEISERQHHALTMFLNAYELDQSNASKNLTEQDATE